MKDKLDFMKTETLCAIKTLLQEWKAIFWKTVFESHVCDKVLLFGTYKEPFSQQ
jgi:hypothetical protein